MTVFTDIDRLPYDERLFPPVFLKSYLKYQQSQGCRVAVVADTHETSVPLVIRKKYGFKVGRFLYKPWNAETELNAGDEKNFLQELRSILREKKLADVLLPPQHICVFHGVPGTGLAAPLGIIRVDLKSKTEEEVFSKFQPRYRTVIRQAGRQRVQIAFGMNCFDDFCRLYCQTQKRENAAGDPLSSIKKMAEHLGESHIQCGVAYADGKPDAALFNIYNGVEAYYLYGGTAAPTLHDGSFKLLHWEAMRQLLKKKVGRYCLGGARRGNIAGTKYQRLTEFKMRFGATIEEGYHLILPVTAKYGLYQTLMKIYLGIRGIKDQSDTMPFKAVSSFS